MVKLSMGKKIFGKECLISTVDLAVKNVEIQCEFVTTV